MRNLITTIQIHGLQVLQPRSDVLERGVSEARALADVQDVEVGQSLADLADALVSNLAGHQRQASQVKQPAGNVNHRPEEY